MTSSQILSYELRQFFSSKRIWSHKQLNFPIMLINRHHINYRNLIAIKWKFNITQWPYNVTIINRLIHLINVNYNINRFLSKSANVNIEIWIKKQYWSDLWWLKANNENNVGVGNSRISRHKIPRSLIKQKKSNDRIDNELSEQK